MFSGTNSVYIYSKCGLLNVGFKGESYNYWQGKHKPFSSPATGVVASGNKLDSKCGLDIAFEQLKHTRKENCDSVCFPTDGEVESSTIQDTQGSRKRRNSSEGLLLHHIFLT